jgi:hypothetical protein
MQFFELHEQPWFPASLRDQITDALQCGMHFTGAYAPIAPMLQGVLDSSAHRSVVDICSGGGGPWLDLSRMLRGGPCEFQIRLTDKYPNLKAFETMRAASKNHIDFCADPINAMDVPREMPGIRTMFSSFHHFPPDQAALILQDAVDARQPIGIFEITRRAPLTILLMIPWALMALLYTPWIRPFRWSRLFWTYLAPLVPLVLLFDGVVSCMRTYRPQEMRELIGTLTNAEYEWEMGEYSIAGGKMPITYLIGRPSDNGHPLTQLRLDGDVQEQPATPAPG